MSSDSVCPKFRKVCVALVFGVCLFLIPNGVHSAPSNSATPDARRLVSQVVRLRGRDEARAPCRQAAVRRDADVDFERNL